MNFSKFSLLTVLALFSTLAVCYAKEAEKDTKAEAVKDDTSADKAKEATAGEGIKVDTAAGATTEGASSDFDIEQLLKLIDALKNQDFDEVDKALKDTKLGGEGPIKSDAADKNTTADKKTTAEKKESASSTSETEEKLEL